MSTTSQIINCAVAAGVLVLSATGVFAQTEQTCLFGRAPVLNSPFSAEVTIVWQPPAGKGTEQRAVARYYRDREGRVRVEQGFAGSGQGSNRIILAPDDSRRVFIMDPATQTASIFPRRLADTMVGVGCRHDHFVLAVSDGGFVSFDQHPVDQESLGERLMSGVQATGTRFTTELPHAPFGQGRAEQWVSPELKLVVYLRSEEPNMGTFEYELTRISRAEPQAELFEAPADSEVIQAAGTRSRALQPGPWRSAYTEMARPPTQ